MKPAALALLLLAVALTVWRAVILPLEDPNRLRLPEPQQVVTELPKLGVHTRLTDEVEQTKIQYTLEMVRDMGAAWDVEYFPWNYIQKGGPGSWDWSHTDLVVNHANRQGLKLIARLDGVPDWARPVATANTELDPASYPAFTRFVTEFATRYRGKIAAYVIWNEPNLAYEWGFKKPAPAEYAGLLRAVYGPIKAADPGSLVLSAPLAPTPENSDRAMADVDYLQGLYDAGAAGSFDGLGAHTYGWRHDPNEPPSIGEVNFRRVELLRQVMERNGDAAKQIYVTETGWNDYPRWVRGVSPAQQVDYTLRAIRMASDWPWLAALCIWQFRLPAAAHNYNDAWSLVRTDFSPTPLYLALQKAATAGLRPPPPARQRPASVSTSHDPLLQSWNRLSDWTHGAALRLACIFTGCPVPRDVSLESVEQAGVLRVAMDASFPPLESVAPDGSFEGIDVDVARAIAGELGVRAEILNMSSDGLKNAVIVDKADVIISSFPAIMEWRDELAYSSTYYEDSVPAFDREDGDYVPVDYVVALRNRDHALLGAVDGALDKLRLSGRLSSVTGEI